MRKPISCPRERLPLWIEVQVGEKVLLQDSLPPTGLSGDGPSRIHRRFVVEPGRLRLIARLRDTTRAKAMITSWRRRSTSRRSKAWCSTFGPRAAASSSVVGTGRWNPSWL